MRALLPTLNGRSRSLGLVLRHVTERGVNKRSALEIQLSRRGIDPSRVLSCGDALNDVSMFNLTGYSVAVNGTIAEVRDAAGSISEGRASGGYRNAGVASWVIEEYW